MSSTPRSAAMPRAGSTMPATPTARPTRKTAASSSRPCATCCPAKSCSTTTAWSSTSGYTRLKKRVRLPLRQRAVPRHDAGAQAALTPAPPAMPDSRHLHWGAEALWQALLPLLPGLSVEVVARAESTNTALLDSARALGGPARGTGDHAGRARRPAGRLAFTARHMAGATVTPSPACWWPNNRPAAAAAGGAAGNPAPARR